MKPKRFTEKLNNGSYDYTKGHTMFEFSGDREKLMNKLGRLEDIEEDLGIDLVKLISANTIFVDEGSGILVVYDYFKISFVEQCVYISIDDCDDMELPFFDYGKTWALTKDEL